RSGRRRGGRGWASEGLSDGCLGQLEGDGPGDGPRQMGAMKGEHGLIALVVAARLDAEQVVGRSKDGAARCADLDRDAVEAGAPAGESPVEADAALVRRPRAPGDGRAVAQLRVVVAAPRRLASRKREKDPPLIRG